MKHRNFKTRIAAFGLALLMGMSPMSSAVNAYAAEETKSAETKAETLETEAITVTEETKVTAEDIIKSVSDDTFQVESCMKSTLFTFVLP